MMVSVNDENKRKVVGIDVLVGTNVSEYLERTVLEEGSLVDEIMAVYECCYFISAGTSTYQFRTSRCLYSLRLKLSILWLIISVSRFRF